MRLLSGFFVMIMLSCSGSDILDVKRTKSGSTEPTVSAPTGQNVLKRTEEDSSLTFVAHSSFFSGQGTDRKETLTKMREARHLPIYVLEGLVTSGQVVVHSKLDLSQNDFEDYSCSNVDFKSSATLIGDLFAEIRQNDLCGHIKIKSCIKIASFSYSEVFRNPELSIDVPCKDEGTVFNAFASADSPQSSQVDLLFNHTEMVARVFAGVDHSCSVSGGWKELEVGGVTSSQLNVPRGLIKDHLYVAVEDLVGYRSICQKIQVLESSDTNTDYTSTDTDTDHTSTDTNTDHTSTDTNTDQTSPDTFDAATIINAIDIQDGSKEHNLSKLVIVKWSLDPDVDFSSVKEVQVALGTVLGEADVAAWTTGDLALGKLVFDNVSLNPGQNYYGTMRIKGHDDVWHFKYGDGFLVIPAGSVVTYTSWREDIVEPSAVEGNDCAVFKAGNSRWEAQSCQFWKVAACVNVADRTDWVISAERISMAIYANPCPTSYKFSLPRNQLESDALFNALNATEYHAAFINASDHEEEGVWRTVVTE